MKWTFARNDGGRDSGFHDAGVETFKGNFDRYLARELIQNSVDARLDPNKPVHVKFEIVKLAGTDIPDVTGLAATLARCREYFPGSKNCVEFFRRAEALIRTETILALRIGDYNTSGVLGSDSDRNKNWYHLIRCAGSTSKGGGEGGSFGIGKNAPFAASQMRTVLYSTYNTDEEHVFQGVSTLVTHTLPSGAKAQATGYLGGEDGASIRVKKGIPAIFQRKEHGTDVVILGFPGGASWQEDLIYSVLDNFWPAIDLGNLIVTVGNQFIHKQNLPTLLESYGGKPDFTAHHYYAAFKNPTHSTHEELRQLKKVSLYLLASSDVDLPRRVAMVRKTGMVIFTKRFQSGVPFCGVFMCMNDQGNKLLWEMEPPRHDTWDPDHPEKGANRKIESEYKSFIIACIKKLVPSDDSKVISIPGLSRWLPDDEDSPDEAFGETEGQEKGEAAKRAPLPERISGKKIDARRSAQSPGRGSTVPEDDEDDDGEEEGGGVSRKKRKKKPGPGEGGGDDSVEVKPVVPIQYRAFALNADAGVYSVSVSAERPPEKPVVIVVGAVGDDQRIGVEVKSARAAGGAELKVGKSGVIGPVNLPAEGKFSFELVLREPLRIAMEVSAHEA